MIRGGRQRAASSQKRKKTNEARPDAARVRGQDRDWGEGVERDEGGKGGAGEGERRRRKGEKRVEKEKKKKWQRSEERK